MSDVRNHLQAAADADDDADLRFHVRQALQHLYTRGEGGFVVTELDDATIERIELEADDEGYASVEDFIKASIWSRFADIDRQLAQKVDVDVEVPDHILKRARLRARHRGPERSDADFDDILFDYISLHPRWLTGGGDVVDE